MKEWELTAEPYSLNQTTYMSGTGVDLAENTTIIPNPYRPVMERSLIVGWTANVVWPGPLGWTANVSGPPRRFIRLDGPLWLVTSSLSGPFWSVDQKKAFS